MLLDVGRIFKKGECYYCHEEQQVVLAYVGQMNWKKHNRFSACKKCIQIESHPKDWYFYQRMWDFERKETSRLRMYIELEDLELRYPDKRVFPILRLLLNGKYPHEKIIEGIHRMWLGKYPTIDQSRRITSLIRNYRNVRTGIKPKVASRPFQARGSIQPSPFYFGTGSCGFF